MDQMNNIVAERGSNNTAHRTQQLQQMLQGKRDSVSPQFAEVHLRHLRDADAEVNETPSTTLRQDWLLSFVEYMKKR